MGIRIRLAHALNSSRSWQEKPSVIDNATTHTHRRLLRTQKISIYLLITLGILSIYRYLVFLDIYSNIITETIIGINATSSFIDHTKEKSTVIKTGKCAILFWGLPRSFATLVLPSVVENVIKPNDKYGCDYYSHFYHKKSESSGRSGSGGSIDSEAIYLLKNAVLAQVNLVSTSSRVPSVDFTFDTEQEFWLRYRSLIETIRNSKDTNGKYLYFPWKAKTYIYPTTTDNIIKMWHSIERVWNLMETKGIVYEHVAMLRSDVVYITPINVFDIPLSNDDVTTSKSSDRIKQAVVIPNFGNHPISDRLIYGAYSGVKIWATERFTNLERHVNWIRLHDPGWGLHSERFLNYTILPGLRNSSDGTTTEVIQHPTMCFLRARSDGSIWVSDCEGPADPRIMKNLGGSTVSIQNTIEKLIGHRCGTISKPRVNVKSLDCSPPEMALYQ